MDKNWIIGILTNTYNKYKILYENMKLKNKNATLRIKVVELENDIAGYEHDCGWLESFVEVLEEKLTKVKEYCEEQNLKYDTTACEVLKIIMQGDE